MSSPKTVQVTQARISRPVIQETEEALIPHREQLRSMGQLGMARAGGQILFDLAFKEPIELVGSPEQLGHEIESRLLHNGELSAWATNALKVILNNSLVSRDVALTITVLCRIATLDLLLGGRFANGSQAN
jgi:hypothetical protein